MHERGILGYEIDYLQPAAEYALLLRWGAAQASAVIASGTAHTIRQAPRAVAAMTGPALGLFQATPCVLQAIQR